MLLPLLAALPVSQAWAQTYPSKPVRIIVPFGPGGVADVTTRLVADKLGEKLGQRFVVENVPGAGGIAAARAAISGGNDGYTLTLLTNGTAISVPLFTKLPFDPLKDFTPISSIGYFDTLFVVSADSQYKTLQDIIKAAKDNPGKLNVGTINPGSTQHLTSELFKSSAGLNFVNVTFRTSGEAVLALLRNDIHLMVDFYAAPACLERPHPFSGIAGGSHRGAERRSGIRSCVLERALCAGRHTAGCYRHFEQRLAHGAGGYRTQEESA
jgi:tripartite-type tricarboxylate transporter receptor subunit TctC